MEYSPSFIFKKGGPIVTYRFWNHVTRSIGLALLGSVIAGGGAAAQDSIKIKMGRLGFPSLSSVLLDVATVKGFDKANGLQMEVSSFGAVSAYYAALATGEVEMLTGGPHVFQKMMLEGVPIKISLTWARMNTISLITADPSIKVLSDLKGKTIAADMGSSEYQILAIYARSQGLVFGKDVTIAQASPALARSQLQANRVEAAMLWEPITTLALRDNPQYRVLVAGDQAWNTIAKSHGWDLVLAMRQDFLARSPAAVPRVAKMLQDAQRFIHDNTDQADEIVVNSVKLPKGILKEGITSGRIVFDVVPAWDSARPLLENTMKIAVDTGYLPKLPVDAIYLP
jgi:NitT/TauT family transport system substrate-binding protein